MTRSQRNITPGKGDISTFLDCPDREEWNHKRYCHASCVYRVSIFCVDDPTNPEQPCYRGYAR
jgi:hypothetical protein